MKKYIFALIIVFSFFGKSLANYDKLAYEFSFKDIDSKTIYLKDYKNKIIIVVNVASRCGFTNQYEDLQKLWVEYKDKNVIVIGVPSNNFRQEPGNNKEIKSFCKNTFGITFPITEKLEVIGDNAHPFFKWAKRNHGINAVPKWNFHKIIVNKEGKIAKTFSSITNPSSSKFLNYIKKEIKN